MKLAILNMKITIVDVLKIVCIIEHVFEVVMNKVAKNESMVCQLLK